MKRDRVKNGRRRTHKRGHFFQVRGESDPNIKSPVVKDNNFLFDCVVILVSQLNSFVVKCLTLR